MAKASAKLSLLAVNQLDSWPIADDTDVPVVLVDPGSAQQQGPVMGDAPRPAANACLDRLDPVQRGSVEQLLGDLQRYVELAEPFERIAEAIREAGLLGGATTDEPAVAEGIHDQAA